MMWNWLFNNSPQTKITEDLNLPSLPLGLYVTLYIFLISTTLFGKLFGLTYLPKLGLGYKVLTTVMVFHFSNTLREHYGWLPEPKIHSSIYGLDTKAIIN